MFHPLGASANEIASVNWVMDDAEGSKEVDRCCGGEAFRLQSMMLLRTSDAGYLNRI